jgi:hypothetical protein
MSCAVNRETRELMQFQCQISLIESNTLRHISRFLHSCSSAHLSVTATHTAKRCCPSHNRADNREFGSKPSLTSHPHTHIWPVARPQYAHASLFITMSARPHVRSKSNGLKPPTQHARSTRPSLSAKRSASYNHSAAAHPSANLRRLKSGVEVVKQSADSDSEDMAASFLQFW